MTDSRQLFVTLMQGFCKHVPRAKFGDIRRLVTLAWAVVGLCISKTVNFSQWGESVMSKAKKAASHKRRFQRWFHNEHIIPCSFYAPLVKAALHGWELTESVYVALDTSVLPRGYVLIRVALVYRGRTVPLAWSVIKHGSATVGYTTYEGVLRQAIAALPSGCAIIWLADRGFLHRQLVRFVKQRPKDHYRIRAKSSTLVRFADHHVSSMGKLCPPAGHAHFYHDVSILDENIGTAHVALANPLDSEDPWYIITDQFSDVTTFEEYGLRFDIEEGFLDDKSNGFQLESTRLDDADSISRLFLVLAVASLHFTSVGTAVVKHDLRTWVDTHWDRGMSYFKIGWSWLRQQFRRGWSPFAPFQLDPGPDPQPAIASRRKAAEPKPTWIVAHLSSP